jgi:hypothetical protein
VRYFVYARTTRRLRPFARRRFSTARPAFVALRLRKPCARLRFTFDGWYVGTRLATATAPCRDLTGEKRAAAFSDRAHQSQSRECVGSHTAIASAETDTQSCGKPLWETLWKLWRTRHAHPVGTVKSMLWRIASSTCVRTDLQQSEPWGSTRNEADLPARNSAQGRGADFTVSLRAFDNQA